MTAAIAEDTGPWTGSVTISDPRISAELRRMRDDLGIPGDRVAVHLKWSTSKISRLELGRTRITMADLERLLDYYKGQGLDPGRAAALISLGRQAAAMDGARGVRLAPGVQLAVAVSEWAPLAVPKLLQVPGYTRAVLAGRQAVLLTPPSEIREAAAAVALWQARLAGDPPLKLRAVLDESVLHRQAGDADVMRAQLNHLDRAGREPGTDIGIRVLPLDGAAPAGIGPFAYLEYPEWPGVVAPGAVLADDLEGPQLLELPERATWTRYLAFQRLWEIAGPPGPVIRRALRALPKT